MNFDVEKIREDFPLLQRTVYNKPLIYLDNAATNQKPRQVLQRLADYYQSENSNIHRGTHKLSIQATTAYEQARQSVARFINAPAAEQIIFTKGTTESINLVATTFGERFVEAGDEILITYLEHHSNIVPWQLMCGRRGATLRVADITQDGVLDLDDFKRKLTTKTKLVAFAHVSNTLGTINPAKELVKLAHDAGARVLIDGAQAVAHLPVDVQALECDFYCFSAHKIYGPMGDGVLFGKKEILEELPPYQGGGEMISEVTFGKTTFNELPFRFEAGTPNVAGALGLEAALHYIQSVGAEEMHQYENELLLYATEKLSAIPGLTIYGNSPEKTGVVTFNLAGIHSYDAGTLLDKFGIAVRTGHMCTQPLTEFYGVPGFIRASFSMYNTRQEVDALADAIMRSREMLL
ncbi:MAG: cysteine desulfurase [Bacteroidales bacterium]|nr:cysteine desulfurase [Bacteroidales bacterium]MDY0333358.1 cysteine desulfurase [Bacteroidales bacterium]